MGIFNKIRGNGEININELVKPAPAALKKNAQKVLAKTARKVTRKSCCAPSLTVALADSLAGNIGAAHKKFRTGTGEDKFDAIDELFRTVKVLERKLEEFDKIHTARF